MSAYMYAAQIGDYIKIGHTGPNVLLRLEGLRSKYGCDVKMLAVKPGPLFEEVRFHCAHQSEAVASEIYPSDSKAVSLFMEGATAFVMPLGRKVRMNIRKWTEPLPPGVIPRLRCKPKVPLKGRRFGKLTHIASATDGAVMPNDWASCLEMEACHG